MATPLHHEEWIILRHLIFRFCVFISINAALANLLPNSKKLDKHPDLQCFYEIAIFLVAAFSLNWRACLPSLDAEFLGFHSRPSTKALPHVRERWKRRTGRKRCR